MALRFILQQRPKRVGQGRIQAGEFPRFLLSLSIIILIATATRHEPRATRHEPPATNHEPGLQG
jgi:hypothetical protein